VGIWDQLNTKTIKDVASADIQRQSNAIHLEENNRQALMDVALINKSQLRDGKPMPDQGKVVQTSGDSDRIQFQPNAGEVWQFVGGDILETASGTFSVNIPVFNYGSRGNRQGYGVLCGPNHSNQHHVPKRGCHGG
jgi:hypothetical protein